jgi:Rps23 Pro-64 3,4-dihydroxylase Tpa1-like proline 4-hydroxylase
MKAKDTRFAVAADAEFQVSPSQRQDIVGRVEGHEIQFNLDVYRLLMEFESPRTMREVFAAIGSDMSFGQFTQGLAPYVKIGLLVEVSGDAEPEGLSIRDVASKHLCDRRTLSKIRQTLDAGKLCIIRDAFTQSFAEETFKSIDAVEMWQPRESYQNNWYHSKHHFVATKSPQRLVQQQLVFAHPRSKAWAHEISGCDTQGRTEVMTARYEVGDYTLPHADVVGTRRIAFLWYLTKSWPQYWGGQFFWCSPPTLVPPTFNTLVLFDVKKGGVHLVCPVSPLSHGKRVAVTGWWHSKEPAKVRPTPAYGETARLTNGMISLWEDETERLTKKVFAVGGRNRKSRRRPFR